MEWLYHQNRGMSSGFSSTADRIAHTRNCGEHVMRVGAKQIYVDGCFETTNTVREFSVCFYPASTTCFPNHDQKNANSTIVLCEMSTRVLSPKLTSFVKPGTMPWKYGSCECTRLTKQNASICPFVNCLDLVARLEPHKAFFEGRTNAVKLYHTIKDSVKIVYVDFTSSYPWVASALSSRLMSIPS